MTVTFRTVVLHLPPTPLGLLPEKWLLEHRCSLCHCCVTPEQLIAHARDHGRNDGHEDEESFQSPPTSATLAAEPPINEGGE